MGLTKNTNKMETLGIRTDDEMKDVLMHPEETGPKAHYYMIRGGSNKRNVTVWASGTVGGEFIKTYGHYHLDDIGEIYEILLGKGVLLMQKRKMDENNHPINDDIEWIKAVFVKQGDKVDIPPKAGHLMINIGDTWLVAGDNSPVAMTSNEKAAWPTHADYSAIKKLRGFAYYAIQDENSENNVKFVKNQNYKVVSPIIIENAS